MSKWLNCPCGSTPRVTKHNDDDWQYEHMEAYCEACWHIHVEAQYEDELRKKWNDEVKKIGDLS